jgi:hypothetical protein
MPHVRPSSLVAWRDHGNDQSIIGIILPLDPRMSSLAKITCLVSALRIRVLGSVLFHPLVNEMPILSLISQEIPISAGRFVRWIYLVRLSIYLQELL